MHSLDGHYPIHFLIDPLHQTLPDDDAGTKKLTWKDLWDLGWRCAVLYKSTNYVRCLLL